MPLLSIIIPCYNEEASLPTLFSELEKVITQLPVQAEYLFINDGSTDGTLKLLRDLHAQHPTIHYFSFSRNFGKEAAIYAGLKAAQGDYITLLDADLQDPPDLLLAMYAKIQEPEIDCVAARRTTRDGEPFLVSSFSRFFYRLMNRISDTPIIDGVRDFRLMTRQMVESLLELSEYNRFSKGLFTWIGYETAYIPYSNQARYAGKTKWSFWSRVRYAIEGITNFSEIPLNIATYLGLFVVIMTVLAIIILIIRQLVFQNSVSGWTSTTVIILLCFGVTLMMLGIIGKYISKIFLESKKRPLYIIKERDEN